MFKQFDWFDWIVFVTGVGFITAMVVLLVWCYPGSASYTSQYIGR